MAADAPKPTTPPPATPLSGLVKKFTEEHTAQPASLPAPQSAAQPVAQPVAPPTAQPIATAASPEHAAAEKKTADKRKAPPSLASLPAPTAAGPLRILLVDDDWSDNNASGGTRGLSGSDKIFRELVAAAVGGDAASWSVEIAENYKNGPAFERLRNFNVVLWYTGDSYGGNPDHTSVLSLEDEKTARRYLEETGGSFILISPGYPSNLYHGSTWTESPHPFLKEVIGVNGIAGLVQRFSAGQVQAHDGSSYTVEQKGAAEPQFSAVNSDGAAIVFTASLDPVKTAAEPVPVSVAHPFGGGRFVYVGFTFENIAEKDRSKAFGILLSAAVGSKGAAAPVAGPAAPVARTPVANLPNQTQTLQTIKETPPAPPGPAPTEVELSPNGPAAHDLRWLATGMKSFEVFRHDPDGWRFLKGGFLERFYTDRSFVAPNSAYKVVAVYADGRRGETIVQYPNPPQPERPTGLKVIQTGPDTIQLDWVKVPHVGSYRIHGPGAPAAGVRFTTDNPNNPGPSSHTTMNSMPIGVHEIRVTAEYYGENGAKLIAPIYASANVAVNSDRGRYRMVFLGVQAVQQATDDIFDGDGKGNEIFGGAFWATASQTVSGPATGGGFARTKVYGDTQGFPDRIRAGSAGATGGLRTGDYAPSANVLMPQAGAGLADQFPLKLWEGELIETGPAVAVIPIIFEWNSADHSAWSWWADYWSQSNTSMNNLGDKIRSNRSAPLAPQDLYGTWSVEDYSKTIYDPHEQRPSVPEFNVAAGRDRPIGLMNVSPPGKVPNYGHRSVGFVLTRRSAEATLAGQSLKMLQLPWSDGLSGKYTGFFQLERLSEAPLVAPPPAPPAPTMTVQPIVPIMGAMAVPATPPPATAPPATPAMTELPAGNRNVGGQTIKPVETPPPGPPPLHVFASSENPARQQINWGANGATTSNVFRKEGDRWILVVGDTTFTTAIDHSFVAPGTVYQVVGRHADGRVGQAEFTFATPSQPLVASELKVTPTGERKVKLTWKMPGDYSSRGHRVFAPGLPADGQLVPLQSGPEQMLEITNVPEGTHLFRVAKQYDELVAPVDARVMATVTPWSEQYRFVLLGFRVQRKTTDDDIFDGDGRGDEVFFGAYRASLPDGMADPSSLGFVQSLIMGDTNRFPTRVQAGHAGPTGGIRSGDAVPSDAALVAQPGIASTTDRLPLLLWQGALSNDSKPVVVVLTAFEWDNTSVIPWDTWKNWWSSPNGSSMLRVEARAALAAAPDEIRYVPLTSTYELEAKPSAAVGTPKDLRYLPVMIHNRPIGNRPIGALKLVDPTYWYCVPHGFALTRNNVEKTLGTRAAAVVSASLTMQRGPTVLKPEEQDEADYTLYVQIERVSGAPVTAP